MPLPRGVGRGDTSSPGGGELLGDDLQRGRDRHADDRADEAEEGPKARTLANTVKPETCAAFPMIVGCRT